MYDKNKRVNRIGRKLYLTVFNSLGVICVNPEQVEVDQ